MTDLRLPKHQTHVSLGLTPSADATASSQCTTTTVVLIPAADKELQRLSDKNFNAVAERLDQLEEDPSPADRRPILGMSKNLYRIDVGEYRVCFGYDRSNNTITVYLIDRRNDEAAYKRLKRRLR